MVFATKFPSTPTKWAEDFVESESSIPSEEVSLASEILEPPIPLKSVLSTFWCLLGACYGRSKWDWLFVFWWSLQLYDR